ncbi:MAG: Gfo/Idh/MocA family oxidoreductase [Clostridia bacterium]|nr:Gfo/Idh/MocA family oxidoreductase [Clostridia bacterium]
MKKLRFGVIGAGGIADRRTIPGLLQAKNAELAAVMGPNLARTEKIREKYGAKRAYDQEEALLQDPEVDAVYIATPVAEHARQAKLAADYGKHILMEKPLAMTAAEAEETVRYCTEKKVQIAAGLMMRFGTQVQNMKKAIAEGKIGTVVSGYAQFSVWLPFEEGNWRQIKAKAGGGAMMDLSVHTLDLMEYISGMRVTQVASMNEKIAFPEEKYDVEDSSTMLLRMENGAQCVLQSNFNIPDEVARWRVEFFGTKGRLMGDTVIGQMDTGTVNAVFLEKNNGYSADQTHHDEKGISLSGEFGNLYTREIESFADSVLNGKPLVVPASDVVHLQKIMEYAYRSSAEMKVFPVTDA